MIKSANIDPTATFIEKVMPISLQGVVTAGQDPAYVWFPRNNVVIVDIDATCSAKTGSGAITWDIEDDGTSVLTTKPDLDGVAAKAQAAGVVNTTLATIAAGSVVEFVFAIAATNATNPTAWVTYREEVSPSEINS